MFLVRMKRPGFSHRICSQAITADQIRALQEAEVVDVETRRLVAAVKLNRVRSPLILLKFTAPACPFSASASDRVRRDRRRAAETSEPLLRCSRPIASLPLTLLPAQ